MKNEIKEIHYPQNSLILVENSINEGYFYIVKSGSILIQSNIYFSDECLNKYQAGDTFGLVSAITKNPVHNTLTAETDCRILQIPISLLGNYLHSNREICLKIIASYSNQLRALDNYLVAQCTGHENVEHPAKLFDTGTCYADMGQTKIAVYCYAKYIEWAKINRKGHQSIAAAEKSLHELSPDFTFSTYETNTLSFKKGEVIFVENEPAEYFYVVNNGEVKISKLINKQEFILAILRKGEIFGEMAVLNKKVRNASAIAFEDTTILRLPADTFMDKTGDIILARLFQSFARRIWYTYQRVYLLGFKNPNAKLYSYLQILISDINIKNKNQLVKQKEYFFNYNLNDLKMMIGMADLEDKHIHDFLMDTNVDISNHSIRIYDKRKIDEKVIYYKSREEKEEIKKIYL